MTTRELEIIKALLDVAHDAEGGQFSETQLHTAGGVKLQERARLAPTLGEFNAALGIIGTRGWMTRVENRITGRARWNINDAGEAAREEIK